MVNTGETTILAFPHPSLSDSFETSQCLAFPFPSFPLGLWVLSIPSWAGPSSAPHFPCLLNETMTPIQLCVVL